MALMKRALNSYFDKIEPVLLVLGFSFLAVYAYQVLAQPTGAAYDALSIIQALIYASSFWIWSCALLEPAKIC